MNNLELQQKIYDFEIILYGYLKKFPLSEKFAMTTEIKKTVFEFYKLIYKASKLENKKTITMKHGYKLAFVSLLLVTVGINAFSKDPIITVNVQKPIAPVQPTMWGIFFEDSHIRCVVHALRCWP